VSNSACISSPSAPLAIEREGTDMPLIVSTPGTGQTTLAEVGHDTPGPRVLTLELPEPLRLISLRPAVFLAPPVVRLVGDAQVLRHLAHRAAFRPLDLRLPKLPDDLFPAVPPPAHD